MLEGRSVVHPPRLPVPAKNTGELSGRRAFHRRPNGRRAVHAVAPSSAIPSCQHLACHRAESAGADRSASLCEMGRRLRDPQRAPPVDCGNRRTARPARHAMSLQRSRRDRLQSRSCLGRSGGVVPLADQVAGSVPRSRRQAGNSPTWMFIVQALVAIAADTTGRSSMTRSRRRGGDVLEQRAPQVLP
jgi:hypothetical protein